MSSEQKHEHIPTTDIVIQVDEPVPEVAIDIGATLMPPPLKRQITSHKIDLGVLFLYNRMGLDGSWVEVDRVHPKPPEELVRDYRSMVRLGMNPQETEEEYVEKYRDLTTSTIVDVHGRTNTVSYKGWSHSFFPQNRIRRHNHTFVSLDRIV